MYAVCFRRSVRVSNSKEGCRDRMNLVDKALRNGKLHLLVLVFTVLAETVGVKTFKLGPGMLVLVPLLYSFVLGALSGLPSLKILQKSDMFEASSLVGVSFFLLMARYGTLVGPNFWKVVQSGPALILQEFGLCHEPFLCTES